MRSLALLLFSLILAHCVPCFEPGFGPVASTSSTIHSASRPVQPSGSSALSRPRKCSIMARPMVPFPLAFDSARSVLAVKGHASVAGIGLKRDTVHDTFMVLSSRTKRYGDSMNEMTPAV